MMMMKVPERVNKKATTSVAFESWSKYKSAPYSFVLYYRWAISQMYNLTLDEMQK